MTVRPLTDSYPLAYGYDPAFDAGLVANKGDSKRVREKKFAEEYLRCKDRCDYSSITRPGATPTFFWFRPLEDNELRRLRRIASKHQFDPVDLVWLVVRVSLQRVENPSHGLPSNFELEVDAEFPELGKIVAVEWMDALGRWSCDIGRTKGDATNDLGAFALQRSSSPSPK